MESDTDDLVRTLVDVDVIRQLRQIGNRERKRKDLEIRKAHVSMIGRLLRLSDQHRGDIIAQRPAVFNIPPKMRARMNAMNVTPVEHIDPQTSDRGPAPKLHDVLAILKETMARFPRHLDQSVYQEVLDLIDVKSPDRPQKHTTTI